MCHSNGRLLALSANIRPGWPGNTSLAHYNVTITAVKVLWCKP